MFLRIFMFALFLIPFQLQAGDISFNVERCTKKDFIKKTKLELELCAVATNCPKDVIDIIEQCIQNHTHIVEIPKWRSSDEPCIMIFDKTKLKHSTIQA
jgi:hypothetical protein